MVDQKKPPLNLALLVYMLKRGEMRKDMTQYFGVADKTLLRLLRNNGLYENKRIISNRPTKEAIEELVLSGCHLSKAALLLGINVTTLRSLAVHYGLQFPKRIVADVFCHVCKKKLTVSDTAPINDRRVFQDRKKCYIQGHKVSCSDDCHQKLKIIVGIEKLKTDKKEGTSIELAIKRVLDNLGISYLTQKRIGFSSCDFYLPDSMTVIECQGTFHHADPRMYDHNNLSPIQRKVTTRDKSKKTYLVNRGYALLALWQREIDNDIPWCTQQILSIHESRKTAAADMSLFCAGL